MDLLCLPALSFIYVLFIVTIFSAETLKISVPHCVISKNLNSSFMESSSPHSLHAGVPVLPLFYVPVLGGFI